VFFSDDVNGGKCVDLEEFWGEKGDVAVVRLARTMVRSSGKGIVFAHGVTGFVVASEVEVGEEEGPPSLAPVEFLGSPEIFQIFMICPDLKGLSGGFQVVSPFL
jgi:hypothetical protein